MTSREQAATRRAAFRPRLALRRGVGVAFLGICVLGTLLGVAMLAILLVNVWLDGHRLLSFDFLVYRSWFLGHFASGNHAAAPVLGKSAWRTAAGVRWPWRSTSQAWL